MFPKGEGYVITPVKILCNNVSKGKIRPQVRDMYSKLNVGKIYPNGNPWMCVLAKENWQRH